MTLLKTRMMQDLKLAGHAPKAQITAIDGVALPWATRLLTRVSWP